MLVNTPVYGAYNRSTLAWCSLYSPKFAQMALHELAHTFSLSDEYEGKCGTPDTVKFSPVSDNNVGSDLTKLEWAPQGGPQPVLVDRAKDESCHLYKEGPKPDVGAWEGALGRHTMYYRPSKTCRMRDSYREFCPVCSEQIESHLRI